MKHLFKHTLTRDTLLYEYVELKLSRPEIAKKYGCSLSLIIYYFNRYGLQIRNQHKKPRQKGKPTCKHCGKSISYQSKTCYKCHVQHYNWKRGQEHHSWKGALHTQRKPCPICNKLIKLSSNLCYSCNMKNRHLKNPEKHSKSNNPNWKGGKPHCIDCGKKLTEYKYTRCSNCLHKYQKKENNPNWRGGTSFIPYNLDWTIELRNKIRNLYNNECAICHKSNEDNKRALHVHHIDYDKQNCSEENLIPLCTQCHLKTNGNRKYWIEYFKNKRYV